MQLYNLKTGISGVIPKFQQSRTPNSLTAFLTLNLGDLLLNRSYHLDVTQDMASRWPIFQAANACQYKTRYLKQNTRHIQSQNQLEFFLYLRNFAGPKRLPDLLLIYPEHWHRLLPYCFLFNWDQQSNLIGFYLTKL